MAQARKAHGFTQSQLAEAIGVDPVTLSRFETGDRAMSLSTLAAVAAALEVSAATLLADEGGLPTPEHGPGESELLRTFARLSGPRRKLVLSLLRELDKRSKRRNSSAFGTTRGRGATRRR